VSGFPVTSFRVTVYGSASEKASVRILVSPDGETWTEAPTEPRVWDETFWVAGTPAGWQPAKAFWVRVQLTPNADREDWPWSVSVSDLKVEAWMDTEGLRLPAAQRVRYLDATPGAGMRGLLDLDW
jgi:hypothetical protein